MTEKMVCCPSADWDVLLNDYYWVSFQFDNLQVRLRKGFGKEGHALGT
jgi:hypothetical protein